MKPQHAKTTQALVLVVVCLLVLHALCGGSQTQDMARRSRSNEEELYTCDVVVDGLLCGFIARSRAGAVNHKRFKHAEAASAVPPGKGTLQGALSASAPEDRDSGGDRSDAGDKHRSEHRSAVTDSPPGDRFGGYDGVINNYDGDYALYDENENEEGHHDTELADETEDTDNQYDPHRPPQWLCDVGVRRLGSRDIMQASRRAALFDEAQARLADIALRGGMSVSTLDDLLSYIHSLTPADIARLPYRGQTLFNRLDAAMDLQADPAALQRKLFVLDDGTKTTVQFYDIWAVIHTHFLKDDEVASKLVFASERVFERTEAGPSRETNSPSGDSAQNHTKHGLSGRGKLDQVFSEMWTAHWWREQEKKCRPGQFVLAVILHIDDTPVVNRSVTPVTVTLGNLPYDTRRKKGGIRPVAYIPVLQASERERNSESFRLRRRRYLHNVISFLLKPLVHVMNGGGVKVKVGGRFELELMPFLAVVIADHDEKGRLALCFHKYNCALPCYQCAVPAAGLGDATLCSTNPFPPRTVAEAKELRDQYLQTEREGKPGYKGELAAMKKEHSMHLDVDNAFFEIPNFDIFTSMPPEILHDADLGVSRWMVLCILDHLKAVDANAILEFDHRLQVLTTPAIPGVKSFGPQGFTGLSRYEGAHFRALVQLLPVCLIGLSTSSGWTAIVELVIRWHGLYSFTRQAKITDSKLCSWQMAAAEWAKDFQRLLGRYMPSEGAFPKLHSWLGGHLAASIRRYGVPLNFDSSAFERAHVENVKVHSGNISRSHDTVQQIAQRANRTNAAASMAGAASAALASNSSAAVVDGDDSNFEFRGGSDPMTWDQLSHLIGAPPARLRALVHSAVPGGRNSSVRAFSRMRLASGQLAYAKRVTARLTTATTTSEPRLDFVEVLRPASRDEEGLPWIARIHAIVSCKDGVTGFTTRVVVVQWLDVEVCGTRRSATSSNKYFNCVQPGALIGVPGEWDLRSPAQLVRRVAVSPAWQGLRDDYGHRLPKRSLDTWVVNMYILAHGHEELNAVAPGEDSEEATE